MGKIYRQRYQKKYLGSPIILSNQYNYIYEAIKKIPFGKIITFRKLAYKLGNGITPNVINTAFRLCPNP